VKDLDEINHRLSKLSIYDLIEEETRLIELIQDLKSHFHHTQLQQDESHDLVLTQYA